MSSFRSQEAAEDLPLSFRSQEAAEDLSALSSPRCSSLREMSLCVASTTASKEHSPSAATTVGREREEEEEEEEEEVDFFSVVGVGAFEPKPASVIAAGTTSVTGVPSLTSLSSPKTLSTYFFDLPDTTRHTGLWNTSSK